MLDERIDEGVLRWRGGREGEKEKGGKFPLCPFSCRLGNKIPSIPQGFHIAVITATAASSKSGFIPWVT